MELFFLAQTASPAPGAGRLFSEISRQIQAETGPLLGTLLLWFAAVQIIFVLAYWIASKFVARRRDFDDFGEVIYSTFKNALKVYALHLLLFVVLGVVIAIRLPALALYVAAAQGAGTAPAAIGLGTILLVGGVLLLVVAGLFLVPMRIYRVSFGRAIVFLVLGLGLLLLGELALSRVIENPVGKIRAGLVERAKKNPGERSGFLGLVAQSARDSADADLERTAADRSKPLAERKAALDAIYTKLVSIYTALPRNDRTAVAAYEKRQARYTELVTQVRADAAVAQPPVAPPLPVQ